MIAINATYNVSETLLMNDYGKKLHVPGQCYKTFSLFIYQLIFGVLFQPLLKYTRNIHILKFGPYINVKYSYVIINLEF